MVGDQLAVGLFMLTLLVYLHNAQAYVYDYDYHGPVLQYQPTPSTGPSASVAGAQTFQPHSPATHLTLGPQAPASPYPDFKPHYHPTRGPPYPGPHPIRGPPYPVTRPTRGPPYPGPHPIRGPPYPGPHPTRGPPYPGPHPTRGPQYPAARPDSTAPSVSEPVKTAVVIPNPLGPDSVKAFCGEGSVIVEAQMDLLGIGQLIQPSEITLGGCWPTGQDDSAQVLVFETELQGCGSALTMTEDSLTYAFSLIYEPKAIGASPIIRTNGAVVHIKCHYVRLHNVSSDALKPTWIPYSSTMSSEELLAFSLRLMTSNWQVERSSNIFQLGDLMNIEASVVQANHVPLRVFVDGCIATMEPNMHAVPSYTFIENHGCLTDAKLTGSHSTFLPRVQDDKLYFQLDAFRFFQETRSSIYIFCHLKVAAASALTDAQYKACSFSAKASRWVAAGGNDQVCGCCDAGCSLRKGRSLEHEAADVIYRGVIVLSDLTGRPRPAVISVESMYAPSSRFIVACAADQWNGDAMLGPIYVQKTAGNGMVPESQISLVKAEDHRAAGFSPMAVILAGVVFAVGLICATLLGTVLLQRLQTNV